MRVYLDTNVVVSAVATRGLCADVLQVILAEHELVVGEAMVAELPRVLHKKLGLPTETIDDTVAFLRRQATVVRTEAPASLKGVEPGDAAIVAEALAGAVDLLVTGDHGLLTVPGLPVKTVSPRELWDRLRRAT
ncbi:MAG: putative toxin-antitoxin system toxin component, PIN family [Gemmatimonadetes bacterium]|nr:putative toxin-antitoxin system toxin component, PIN family [Gemmatimonadota bacterium]MBI2403865.1 putative toxin-antitoxin system toxin component, PIN family [Gemmatimonadota bacterium]MBI2536152.1 putative toxin-antitoxin system toxin component, PIN family [Gemmatimonadota bacterium]